MTPFDSNGYSDQPNSADQSHLQVKTKQADKCSLCENSGQLLSSEYIRIDSNLVSCEDFASFLSESNGVPMDQCLKFREYYSGKCCNINHATYGCSLCGDSSLDWDASVFFSGEELSCHELESNIVLEKAFSEQCETNQRLYFGACCIEVPENPCHLCNSDGFRLNMESPGKVSHLGEEKTCLDVHHYLHEREEESSRHCIEAQGELFDLCCESSQTTLYSFGASLPIDMQAAPKRGSGGVSPPLTTSTPQNHSPEFMSWYAGQLSSNAQPCLASISSFPFLAVGLMIMI